MTPASSSQSPPIKPAAYNFGDLLDLGTLHVPRYQRAYDWDEDQVLDFARDTLAVARARVDGKPIRHFFGAIISIYEPQGRFEIVDGQQRITTHMLALNELRNRWLQLAELTARTKRNSLRRKSIDHADRLHKLIFNSKDEMRLTLSKRDKDFFADMLMHLASPPKRGADQSHSRLWDAQAVLRAELFDELVDKVTQYESRAKRLVAAEEALLCDGYVVHLNTDDGSNAYRLFMVLNDRGRPLSVGELLRTHTLAELEGYTPQQDAAEQDWDEMLRKGDPFVNRFLAAYYVSYVGSRAPTGEMFDRFRDRFLNDEVHSVAGATKLREKIALLRAEAETFALIYSGAWPYDNPAKPGWERDRLTRLLVALRHHLADPLLLAAARELKETDFCHLVLRLEPFVFRYINIVNANAARLADVYYRHAEAVRTDQKLDKNKLRKDLVDLTARYAPDNAFEALLGEQLRFASKRARTQLIKHFLTTVEDYASWFAEGAIGKPQPKDKTSIFTLDDVNLEHIYPQNPANADRTLEKLKHSLGNLTLLDPYDGVRAGNKSFSDKQPIFRKSRFGITKPLGRLSDWDQASISSRVDFYTERALKIFVVK
jgi:hypothetical protein